MNMAILMLRVLGIPVLLAPQVADDVYCVWWWRAPMKKVNNEIRLKIPRLRYLPAESVEAGPITTCTGTFDRPGREIFVKRGLDVGPVRHESPSSPAPRADR